jgi:hypothetical protein
MGKGEVGAWRVWKSDHVIGYRTLDLFVAQISVVISFYPSFHDQHSLKPFQVFKEDPKIEILAMGCRLWATGIHHHTKKTTKHHI